MDVIVLIGRILFSALFVMSGMNHFARLDAMSGYASQKGIPAARAAVALSGLILLAGGLSVLLGVWGDLGALLLAGVLVPITLGMHRFWAETDEQAQQTEMAMFMKNTALIGAALIIFALFAYAGADLGLTITGPLFSLS